MKKLPWDICRLTVRWWQLSKWNLYIFFLILVFRMFKVSPTVCMCVCMCLFALSGFWLSFSIRLSLHVYVFIIYRYIFYISVQFSSVAQSCPTLCDPMNCGTPGLPAQHQLPEFTQTHIHRVSDAIQPSHPLSSLFPSAPNPSCIHKNII